MSARIGFWSSIALAALLSLGLAASAHALTTLVSPNVSAAPGDFVVCNIVNAGTKAIAVTIQIVEQSGDVSFEDEITVPPGEARILSAFNQIASCRFIGGFSKTLVRASIDVFSDNRTIAVAVAE